MPLQFSLTDDESKIRMNYFGHFGMLRTTRLTVYDKNFFNIRLRNAYLQHAGTNHVHSFGNNDADLSILKK